MTPLSVDVVFSFRNEEDCLPELLRRLRRIQKNTPNVTFTFIFVDDCSSDSSLKILKNDLSNGNLKIIVLSRRFGNSQGKLAGLRESTSDATIYMDADLQDPPELIPLMVEKFKLGFDVVHMKRSKRRGEWFLKMLITKIAYKLIHLVSYIELEPNVGDFKLLSRRVRSSILELVEYDSYFRGLSVWVGFRQITLEYSREPRFSGRTHFSIFRHGPILEFLRGITSFSNFLLIISILNGLLGVLILSVYILFKLLSIFFIQISLFLNFEALIIFTLYILFINLMVIGIYISKIFNASQNRPQYIIMDKFFSDTLT